MSDPGQTRRLAAILAADVAGYSRLMGLDDVATVKTLNEARVVFRERIEHHHGQVTDMAGDSVLAVFPSALEAVRCAVGVQAALREMNAARTPDKRMLFRIGVNVGDIIEQPDGTVYGDGVNIAARLESIGEPGGVCVSGTVFDQVKTRVTVRFEFLGEQQVKNIAELVRAFRVLLEEAGAAAGAGATRELPLPDKPSVAVLPFDNMSSDPEQEFFADGVVESITASLSRISSFFVIARNSAFRYKGRPVKAILSSPERMDAQVEQLVSRLSLEKNVVGLNWQLLPAGRSG